MRFALIYAALTLLGVSIVISIRAALRTREIRRLDVAGLLLIMGLAYLPQGWGVAQRFLMLTLQPYFVLRLLRHFRPVSRVLFVVTLIVPVAFVFAATRGYSYGALQTPRSIYYLPLGTLAAAAFLLEARRSQGVKARRLYLAGTGTALFFVLSAAVRFIPITDLEARRLWLVPINEHLHEAATLCYFLAFTTPRRLIARWRRLDHAEYVGRSAEREPEERGWFASQDLVAGAMRTVGGSVALVARRQENTDQLVVVAASDEKLTGWQLSAETKLIGQALASGAPSLNRTASFEGEVARKLGPYGELSLVAPLVADGQTAGVVIAIHRRGALFPDDDLTALSQMARSAAVAIDHAALVRERRAAAEEAANRRLRELESRVGVMVDSIRDYAMLVVDETGTVAAWHMGAETLFGYPRDQIARRSAGSLFGLPDTELVQWLRESEGSGMAEREGECHRADGTRFIGTTTIRPLVPEKGMPPGFVIVTHDVSEQRRLEERVRQGQKMEAIGTLASGVAHDFNNILAAIIGHADWLESEMIGDARLEQIVEIQRAAERGVDMTQQLLSFASRKPRKAVALDLTQHVCGMLPMLRRLAGPNVEVIDATAPGLALVDGNRSQIDQIVLNLAVNARDAMPDGGRLTLRTLEAAVESDSGAAGPHTGHVLLEVGDTGVGMDAETRRRAFEPFFTTKEVGQGTGLGLATVYGIVQDMHGLIDIDSTPGHGTIFRVYFPRTAEGSQEVVASAPTGEAILLIEDDSSLRTYLRHVLEDAGYFVLDASGPSSALEVAAKYPEPIRLVVSDVAMAGMTGPALVGELARKNPGLVAVFISGLGDGESERFGASAESRWLQKPFSPTDLLDEVRRALKPS